MTGWDKEYLHNKKDYTIYENVKYKYDNSLFPKR